MTTGKNKTGGAFFTLVLLLLFLSLLFLVFLSIDYLGVFNLRQYVPQAMRSSELVKKYFRKATLMSLSDQEQINELMKEQSRKFNSKLTELKALEKRLERKEKGILLLEDRYLKKKQELDSREVKLKKQKQKLASLEIIIDSKKKDLKEEQLLQLEQGERIKRLSEVYEKMEPESAARILDNLDTELFNDIISHMKDSKAAEILNFVTPEKSSEAANEINY